MNILIELHGEYAASRLGKLEEIAKRGVASFGHRQTLEYVIMKSFDEFIEKWGQPAPNAPEHSPETESPRGPGDEGNTMNVLGDGKAGEPSLPCDTCQDPCDDEQTEGEGHREQIYRLAAYEAWLKRVMRER